MVGLAWVGACVAAAGVDRTRAGCDAEANLAHPPSLSQRWHQSVRQQPLTRIVLPYAIVPEYDARLLRLPYRLPDLPDADVHLAWFARPVAIAPVHRDLDSWHAVARYLEGYNYIVTFGSEGARRAFAERLTEVQVPEGRVGSRFTVALTPTQFFEATKRFKMTGGGFESDGVLPATWSEVKALAWTHATTTRSSTRYFIDDRNAVVALRHDGRYYAVVPREARTGFDTASHLEILKRQGRSFAPSGDPFGLVAADRALDRIEHALRAHFARPEFAAAASNFRDQERTVLRASTFATEAGGFDLTRLVGQRVTALAMLAPGRDRDLASDLVFEPEVLCRGPVDTHALPRFAWIRDLSLNGGVLLGRRGDLYHQQMLALAVGRPVLDKLVDLGAVRGGMLSLRFDEVGHLAAAHVVHGTMRVRTRDGRTREIVMSSSERQVFALALFNRCQEKHRVPRR